MMQQILNEYLLKKKNNGNSDLMFANLINISSVFLIKLKNRLQYEDFNLLNSSWNLILYNQLGE